MKPRIIVSNIDLYHNLGMLKHLNVISIKKNKSNELALKKIIKNLNKNNRSIRLIDNEKEFKLEKLNSTLDFNLYIKS